MGLPLCSFPKEAVKDAISKVTVERRGTIERVAHGLAEWDSRGPLAPDGA